MKMSKPILALLPILALAACASGGGESTPSNGGAEESLTVWAWDTNFNIPIMEKAGEYYQEDGHENFSLEVIEMSNADTRQRLISGFTSGVSEGLPDIILVEDYDAQLFLSNYPGKFAELSNDIDFQDFASYKVEALTYDGGVYGIPFDSGSAGLYYRTDYLEEAGYSSEDMENLTWSEFIEIGKAVKDATGKYFVAFIPSRGTHYMQMAMQSAGLWYYDENGEVNFKDNPAIREMADVLKQIHHNDLALPVDYFSAEGVGAVTNGDVAAAVTAVWFSATIKSAEDQSGKWAYTNIPMLETVEGATPYSNLGGSSWFVLADSPNKDLAIDFLKNVYAGSSEFYQDILVNNAAVGTYLPAQTDEAYQFEDEFFNGAQIYKDFSEWSAEIPGVNYGQNTALAIESLRTVLQAYFDDEMTLDETLEAAEEYYRAQSGQ